jgi:hypothetical protein
MKPLALILIALFITPASAQLRPRLRFTLNPESLTQSILKAFSQQGIITDATHIALLTNVIATDPNPTLDIRSTTSFRGSSTIQLTCRKPASCLPFYILTNLSPTTLSKPTAPIIMHSNTAATLFIDDARSHLKLSVITLQSGAAGTTIKARTRDHKHIYTAEIINPTTLRGSF